MPACIASSLQCNVLIGESLSKDVLVVTDRGHVSTSVEFRVVESGVEQDIVLGQDWFTAYVRVTYDRYSSESTAFLNGQVSEGCERLDYFRDIFNHSARFFIFSNEETVLYAHMVEHGIDPSPTSIEESHQLFLQHMLSASCVVNKESRDGFHACRRVAKAFGDSLHMSYEVYKHFLQAPWTSAYYLRLACMAVGALKEPRQYDRDELVNVLEGRQSMIVKTFSKLHPSEKTIRGFYTLRKDALLRASWMHGLSLETSSTKDTILDTLISHIITGACLQVAPSTSLACRGLFLTIDAKGDASEASHRIELHKVLCYALRRNDLYRLVSSLGIKVEPRSSLHTLRIILGKEIVRIEPGVTDLAPVCLEPYHKAPVREDCTAWPTILGQEVKDGLISDFLLATSSSALSRRVCGVCSEYCPSDDLHTEFVQDLPLELLSIHNYKATGCHPPYDRVLRVIPTGLLSPYLLNPVAVHNLHGARFEEIQVDVCVSCYNRLSVNRLPACALANGNVVGDVPYELQQLSMVEEAMIVLCRTKCMIIQLREIDGIGTSSISQKALKGNVIVYPQDTASISKILPPSVAEIATLICVMFVGSQFISDEVILRSTPLAVRADRVYRGLRWLKHNNHLYRDIIINESVIDELRKIDYLPLHVERVEASVSASTRTSRYDEDVESIPPQELGSNHEPVIPFQSVLITGVDPVSSPNVLRAAALRHLKEGGGNYIRIPHEQAPVNSFDNPTMFPMMYPSLFPYGIGGFDDSARKTPLSMKVQVRHMLRLFDRRYQEHHGFLFSTFNILQRRESLLRTSLRTKQVSFRDIAAQLTSISLETVSSICERLKRDERFIPENDQERRVYKLMQEVNVINGHVCGSPSSKILQRNELRAVMMEEGLPSFFLTINPADVYNPIVKYLAGADIDIDNMMETEIPTFWSQALTVAKNPCVAANFFDIYLKAFIRCLLGYRTSGYDRDSVGGVLGRTKAYYGCVETQGRGTLHCHMLVWLEGALNPDEIKRKIISDSGFATCILRYLEDIIKNETPPSVDKEVISDKHHPSTIRSINPTMAHSHVERLKDFGNVVKSSQYHKHSNTCFKYSKGLVQECRFGLGIERERAESVITTEGEINLRCVDGLINDYNPTMLEALRCNMDVKFIGSGVSAKAALYYITDYITKLDLKSYTAYSALELAIKRLGEYDSELDLPAVRSKKMLQKCANAMISRQELSAPIVAAYLLGHDDHYSSHGFSKLYWLSFERYIDVCLEAVSNSEDANDRLEVDEKDDTHKQADNIDLVFDADVEGVITPLASQVDDYVNRSRGLDAFCVWDMIAQLVKMPKHKTYQSFQYTRSSRVYDFLPSHQDFNTHAFHVRTLVHVPVPIGPGLPRRDRAETAERHAKVMLILFKPWRNLMDLKSVSESWVDSYNKFILTMPSHTHNVIDNMQLLHECRDSKDDHYDAMRRKRKLTNFVSTGHAVEDDESGVPVVVNDAEVLEYLESIDTVRSHTEAQKSLDVAQCILSAVNSGLVPQYSTSLMDLASGDELSTVLVPESPESSMEEWRKAYTELDLTRINDHPSLEPSGQKQTQTVSIQLGTDGVFDGSIEIPKIVSVTDSRRTVSGHQVINAIEGEFSLNQEQKRAFRIVATHSIQNGPDQLRIFIMGHGGTGKSRVIQALTAFFARRGQEGRFLLGAFTGVAAMHIGGSTIHALMGLGKDTKKRRKMSAKTRRRIMARWEMVDYLLIDEVSMIGCSLLYDISQGLIAAKGCDLPFGGVNMIFSGDFAQLPPVRQVSLFTQVTAREATALPNRKRKRDAYSDNPSALGRLLWMDVDCVVELREIMRQSGPENSYFVSLLDRVREGRCTDEDYRCLNERMLDQIHSDVLSSEWSDVPIIVYSNAMKDALNIALTISYARKHNKACHWYHAEDYISGEPVTNRDLRDYLFCLDSGRSKQRMGKMPLVEGMPVMICHNYAVENGVANGTLGNLKKICYQTNSFGERVAVACTVQLPNSDLQLSGFDIGEVPVFPEDTDLTFHHPFISKQCYLKRRQVCLMPAAHAVEPMYCSPGYSPRCITLFSGEVAHNVFPSSR